MVITITQNASNGMGCVSDSETGMTRGPFAFGVYMPTSHIQAPASKPCLQCIDGLFHVESRNSLPSLSKINLVFLSANGNFCRQSATEFW